MITNLVKIENMFGFYLQSDFDLQEKFSLNFDRILEHFKEFIETGKVHSVSVREVISFNTENFLLKLQHQKLYLESKETVLDRICLLLKRDMTMHKRLNLRSYLKTLVIQNQKKIKGLILDEVQRQTDEMMQNIQSLKDNDGR